MPTRFIIVASFQMMILFGLVSPEDAHSVTVDDVISLVRDQALKVETLEGWVDHEVRAEGDTQELTGKLYYKAPHRMKIRYVSPEEILVLSARETLWTYTPSMNQVDVVQLSSPDFATGQPEGYMQFVLDPITPLLGSYSFSFLWSGPIGDYEEVWVLQGGPKRSESSISRLLFWIDARIGKVVRAEVYNPKGALVLIALLDDFAEIVPQVWIPTHHSVFAATPKGDMEIETRLSRLKANRPIRDAVFEVEIPEGVTIISGERR